MLFRSVSQSRYVGSSGGGGGVSAPSVGSVGGSQEQQQQPLTQRFVNINLSGSGQTLFDYTKATDSGDHTVFTVSGKTVWSDKAGYEAIIRPDGVVSGSNMLSPHATPIRRFGV